MQISFEGTSPCTSPSARIGIMIKLLAIHQKISIPECLQQCTGRVIRVVMVSAYLAPECRCAAHGLV